MLKIRADKENWEKQNDELEENEHGEEDCLEHQQNNFKRNH